MNIMTKEQALTHYNNLTNCRVRLEDLRYLESASSAVEALMECSKMVENAGGTLQSRQTMAAIIYFVEKQANK